MSDVPLQNDERLYRHLADDWVDDAGNPNEQACTTKQWKEGICCDRSSMRSPEDTAFGTGRTKVMVISVNDCRSLGLTVTPGTEPDLYRKGQMNEAHCTIEIPAGMSKVEIKAMREEFLKRSTVVTVSDTGTS